ncbi:phosphatase PAP2 family protein [Actinomadura sp. SCN-SB]|uniref:phosphatase PAP2 family protein n=1 Tax=Actinomadura sp. SCN-SB TaxID=3373092 RepID=UPI00375174B7
MLTDTMHVVSFFGSAGLYVPVLVLVYWCVDRVQGARLAVALLVSAAVNVTLKLLFHDPRPFWTDHSVTGHEPHDSFGMPSGHAQNAPVFWGLLAAWTRRSAPWAAAAAVVALIGVSRIVLGVHSPGQVVTGWLIGAGLLGVVLWAEPRVVPWWTRRPLAQQLGLSLATGLAFVVAMWAAMRPLDGWRWPAGWARRIVEAGGSLEPISLSEGAAAAGGLCGLLAGLSLANRLVGYEPGGAVWRRLARIPVGVAGGLVIFTAGLFLGENPVPAFIVQAVLGVWVAAGAPEAFIRLGLAGRTPRVLTRPGEGRPGRGAKPFGGSGGPPPEDTGVRQ